LIGLDTNVLVRYLTQDDAAQARLVNALVERLVADGERAFVGSVVLCELAWVLAGPYRFDRKTIATALERILATSQFEIGGRDAVARALDEFRRGRSEFADYLIGRLHQEAGCGFTATFDRKLEACDAFELLGR
jgi:predicted nucleic-acid-binding protein